MFSVLSMFVCELFSSLFVSNRSHCKNVWLLFFFLFCENENQYKHTTHAPRYKNKTKKHCTFLFGIHLSKCFVTFCFSDGSHEICENSFTCTNVTKTYPMSIQLSLLWIVIWHCCLPYFRCYTALYIIQLNMSNN